MFFATCSAELDGTGNQCFGTVAQKPRRLHTGTSRHTTLSPPREDVRRHPNRVRLRALPLTIRVRGQTCCPALLVAIKLQSSSSILSEPKPSRPGRLLNLVPLLASVLPLLHQWLAAQTHCMDDNFYYVKSLDIACRNAVANHVKYINST
jgi:hypothetical protein